MKKLAFALCSLAIFAAHAQGQFRTQDDAIKNLPSLSVYVDEIEKETERDVIQRSQAQTDAELRLRKAGIKVAPARQDGLALPQLNISIRVVKSNRLPIYVYSIQVQLLQLVSPDIYEKPKKVVIGAVWATDRIGLYGEDRLKEIREALGDCIDEFVNDYLAANPKQ